MMNSLLHYSKAWQDENTYKSVYKESVDDPDSFWLKQSEVLSWKRNPTLSCSNEDWFPDGELSVTYNCLERHAELTPNKKAIIWHGDEISQRRELSYSELFSLVRKIAQYLSRNNISSGDVVGIYMPLIPEAIACMLACSVIGAIHMVTFAGFSSEALAYRLKTSLAKILISVPSFERGGKVIDLKLKVKNALESLGSSLKTVIFDDNTNDIINNMDEYNGSWSYSSRDNLFILYTSGSTGAPKGIVHSALGYLVYSASTFGYIFDARKDDVYFCTSDIGWITGHSYLVYAPLIHGSTIVLFGGNPTYPNASRVWQIIDQEKVSIFYTAPTVIRSLMQFDKSYVNNCDLKSLRILGSVGEPINKEAWEWYFKTIGKGKCPIMDTWWQTETGGIMLAPLRNLNQKPCFASKPFFGVKPVITFDDNSKIVDSPYVPGDLCISGKWPGMCRCASYECGISESIPIKKCLDEFHRMYFYKDLFLSGDGALFDDEGDIRILGRTDDVLNICGHRLSTAEFENIINNIDFVKESAVVPVKHEIKGQAAFIYLVVSDVLSIENLPNIVLSKLRAQIGSIAKPDFMLIIPELPKTRSGKIVRKILKKIASNEKIEKNDLTNIENELIVDLIIKEMKNLISWPDTCSLKFKSSGSTFS